MAYAGKKPIDVVDVTQSQSLTVTDDLTVDSDTLFVDASADSVGINVTPSAPLHVKSDTDNSIFLMEHTSPSTGTGQTSTFIDGSSNVSVTYDDEGVYKIGTTSNPVNGAGFSEKWRFDTSGNFKAATNGIGIDFSASESVYVSRDSVLDDYESGYWEPSLTADSGSFTVNSSYRRLAYIKIGDMVHLQGQLVTSAASSPSGVLRISLPFTSSNNIDIADRSVNGTLMFGAGTGAPVAGANYYPAVLFILGNSNAMQVWGKDFDGGWDNSVADWLGVGDIYVNITYRAA